MRIQSINNMNIQKQNRTTKSEPSFGMLKTPLLAAKNTSNYYSGLDFLNKLLPQKGFKQLIKKADSMAYNIQIDANRIDTIGVYFRAIHQKFPEISFYLYVCKANEKLDPVITAMKETFTTTAQDILNGKWVKGKVASTDVQEAQIDKWVENINKEI